MASLSQYFKGIIGIHDAAYDRKIREKLRKFLTLSTGKVGLLVEVVSEMERLVLEKHRSDLWDWISSDTSKPKPALPMDFPAEFFILRFGPIKTHTLECVAEFLFQHFLPGNISMDLVSRATHLRRTGQALNYMFTVSLRNFETYMEMVSLLSLHPCEWYEHGYYGTVASELFGPVQINMSVTSLEDIVGSTSAGLKGKVRGLSCDAYNRFSPEEILRQQEFWTESELGLIHDSILSPAGAASEVSCLHFRRESLYRRQNPRNLLWDGSGEVKSPMKDLLLITKTPLAMSSLSTRPFYHFIQEWISKRVVGYTEDTLPLIDPGSKDEFGRLHHMLGVCMLRQEELANERTKSGGSATAGGVEKDLATPLHMLSVYNPVTNPEGVFIFPTYLPSHLVRLTSWLESSLPSIIGSRQVHFLHIDSEGQFFQLHTASAGCLIIHTGLNGESELIKEVNKRFFVDISNDLKSLAELTAHVCRHFTLSRTDVVFGGDRAACPLASQSKVSRNSPILPWMDSDILGWYWFVKGRPSVDFVCVRSIDADEEDRIMQSCPSGFKNVENCAYATELGPNNHACVCKKLFGNDWVRKCSIAHPQIWHSYPQSGASAVKGLEDPNHPLHWTVLYYAVADLIKAQSLTLYQEHVDIELITPFVDAN